MTLHATLEHEADQLRALGHGAIGLVNAALILAIVAVILSMGSATPAVLKAIFDFLAWLIGQVVTPLKAGTNTPLTSTLGPAFGAGSSAPANPGTGLQGSSNWGIADPSGGTGGPGGTGWDAGTGGTGGGTAPNNSGLSQTYFPGSTYTGVTMPDGTTQFGYAAQ